MLLRLEAEQLAYVLPRRFGLPPAPIRRHLPTELPQLGLHLERLDSVFELVDGTILNLDLLLPPLMRHAWDTEAVVREGLTLASALPAVGQPRVVGALLALAYHYEGKAVLDRLAEGLMTTSIGELLFAEQLEQGMEQGRARGLAEGRVEGERVMPRRYLERRFGAIPPALEGRIAASDADAITALFDQALAATAIETL